MRESRLGQPQASPTRAARTRANTDGSSKLLSGFSDLGPTRNAFALMALASLALACAPPVSPNFLFLIADDVGVDRIASYKEHPHPARTPVIDSLAAEGVMFRTVWSAPACSTTRAALLTGLQPSRTGIGSAIKATPGRQVGLDPEVRTIPKALAPLGYESFAIGKWHLGGGDPLEPSHPLRAGFDHHEGSLANLAIAEDGYFSWPEYVDGELQEPFRGYATSHVVDRTLARIAGATRPWLAWVAFNATHGPLHVPPAELHSSTLARSPDDDKDGHSKAMIEAMDTEIGRLLETMDPEVRANTVIFFLSDGGTSRHFSSRPTDPSRGGKGTILESGVRVPLIVTGAGVSGRGQESSGLVHVVDLFATVVELAGGSPADNDSVSLVPYLDDPSHESIRPYLYTEKFQPNGGPIDPDRYQRAARNARFKLLRFPKRRAFYDLVEDPGEEHDLIDELSTRERSTAFKTLSRAIEVFGAPGSSR